MAQYIDKEIICEAYIHIEVDDSYTPEKIKDVEIELKKFFDARVKFLLGEIVQTEVETETGSLKIRLTAFAGIAALLGTSVLNYSNFRDSVKAMYEDSKMLAEATNLETVFLTRTHSCDRLHSEARTGIVGKIAKIVTQLETVTGQAANYTVPTKKSEIEALKKIITEINRLNEEIEKSLNKVQNDRDRYCLAKGLHATVTQLPNILSAEEKLKNQILIN